MSAECLACVAGVRPLPKPQGPPGSPLGACANCSSLACGAHGQRDPNTPAFICVECKPQHVAASAAFVGPAGPLSPAQEKVAALFLPLAHNLAAADRIRVRSLDDFIRRHPGYDEAALRKGMERRFPPPGVERVAALAVFTELPGEKWDLLKLAAVLARQLGTNRSRSPPEIVALAETLGPG